MESGILPDNWLSANTTSYSYPSLYKGIVAIKDYTFNKPWTALHLLYNTCTTIKLTLHVTETIRIPLVQMVPRVCQPTGLHNYFTGCNLL